MNHETTNWEKSEKVLYEKWRAEHPDVLGKMIYREHDKIGSTAPEWWVRNYVTTQLLPFFRTEIQTAILEERERVREKIETNIGILERSDILSKPFKTGAVEALKYLLAALTPSEDHE